MKIVVTIGGSIIIKDNDPAKFKDYAEVLHDMNNEHQILVVVGGGKPARDYIGIARGFEASEAACDDIGIEVTRLNAKLLIMALGADAYPKVAMNFHDAMEFGTSGKIVVMGGTEPAHSTDAVGSILAEFVDADLLINATSVDGLYDKDPNKYNDAKMFEKITPTEMMNILSSKEIKAGTYEFFDMTAIQIIKRSNIKTRIINGEYPKNLKKAIKDEIGTVIIPD
ncbi:MAG: UMP kinase [Methanobacterium sp.]|uniref:UMP kinase n=1 Tax=Methanobacterium sp. TaxID=2164 RepID=UPI003D64FFA6|nr:UMP kinase [Methanobacterium sp.]